MDIITITRLLYHPSFTFGTLRVGPFDCYTLERPWLNNRVNVSCIPAGVYIVRLGNFKHRYPNYELLDVPDRTAIEMHRGNRAEDVKGCIILGNSFSFDTLIGKEYLSHSEQAFEQFMETMNGVPEAVLHIRENTVVTSLG